MNQRIYFAFLAILAYTNLGIAQDEPLFTSDNKVDCVNKLVDWCDKMKYPNDSTGLSMISLSVTDASGKFWRVFCTSDIDGTNCTRNGSPWFSCNPEHKLTYKGTQLKKDSTDGVDDGICNTTKMAFNDIFIQNLSFNPVNATTELTKGMESFFQMLAELQEQFDLLRSHVFDCFPFCPRNQPGGSPDGGRSTATEKPGSPITANTNQLERE